MRSTPDAIFVGSSDCRVCLRSANLQSVSPARSLVVMVSIRWNHCQFTHRGNCSLSLGLTPVRINSHEPWPFVLRGIPLNRYPYSLVFDFCFPSCTSHRLGTRNSGLNMHSSERHPLLLRNGDGRLHSMYTFALLFFLPEVLEKPGTRTAEFC